MQTLTLELPETLAQQLRQKHISEQEIQAVVVATLELWLANRDQAPFQAASYTGRFAESGTSFARHLIQENRELFETLAHR